MIIKEIGTLCRKRKHIYNIECDYVNWVGDGHALYPMYKLKKLDRAACYALLDIPDGKEESFCYFDILSRDESIFYDELPDDERLSDDGMIMAIYGCDYKTFVIDDKITFVDNKYFKPIKDLIDNENNVIRYFLRYHNDDKFIVVKSGFVVIAIICASNVLSKSTLKKCVII